jgi:hypothetical protein
MPWQYLQYSYKALIAEKFGDGIMSAIDFRTSVKRVEDPKGDRVVITLDGKVRRRVSQILPLVTDALMYRTQFLPYSATGEDGTWTRENC